MSPPNKQIPVVRPFLRIPSELPKLKHVEKQGRGDNGLRANLSQALQGHTLRKVKRKGVLKHILKGLNCVAQEVDLANNLLQGKIFETREQCEEEAKRLTKEQYVLDIVYKANSSKENELSNLSASLEKAKHQGRPASKIAELEKKIAAVSKVQQENSQVINKTINDFREANIELERLAAKLQDISAEKQTPINMPIFHEAVTELTGQKVTGSNTGNDTVMSSSSSVKIDKEVLQKLENLLKIQAVHEERIAAIERNMSDNERIAFELEKRRQLEVQQQSQQPQQPQIQRSQLQQSQVHQPALKQPQQSEKLETLATVPGTSVSIGVSVPSYAYSLPRRRSSRRRKSRNAASRRRRSRSRCQARVKRSRKPASRRHRSLSRKSKSKGRKTRRVYR